MKIRMSRKAKKAYKKGVATSIKERGYYFGAPEGWQPTRGNIRRHLITDFKKQMQGARILHKMKKK